MGEIDPETWVWKASAYSGGTPRLHTDPDCNRLDKATRKITKEKRKEWPEDYPECDVCLNGERTGGMSRDHWRAAVEWEPDNE